MECRGHVKETISAYTESTMQTTKHYELKGTFFIVLYRLSDPCRYSKRQQTI